MDNDFKLFFFIAEYIAMCWTTYYIAFEQKALE